MGCGTFVLAIVIFAAAPKALGASDEVSLWIGGVAAIVALFVSEFLQRRS